MVGKAHLAVTQARIASERAKIDEFADASPKERETITAMVAAGVDASVDMALRNFKERPGGEYWAQLEDAMWAWQHWKGLSGIDRDKCAFSLRNAGIGSWLKVLRSRHDPEVK